MKNTKFLATESSFEQQITEDIRTVNDTKATLTFADTTSTIHEIPTQQYEKLVNNAIMTSYKNTKPDKQPNKIYTVGQVIKRMFINGKQNCFTTLKYHNPNFLVNKTILVNNF